MKEISGKELIEAFDNSMNSHILAINVLIDRLEHQSTIKQLKNAKRVMIENANRLNRPDLWDFSQDYVNMIVGAINKKYDYVLRLLDFQIENHTLVSKEMLKPNRFGNSLTSDQLEYLFNELKSNDFLLGDIDKNAFYYIFGSDGNESDFKQLKWNDIKYTKWLLAYFIDVLTYEVEKSEKTKWKWAENAFNIKGLRGAKNDYQKTGVNPIGYKKINSIIDTMINLPNYGIK